MQRSLMTDERMDPSQETHALRRLRDADGTEVKTAMRSRARRGLGVVCQEGMDVNA